LAQLLALILRRQDTSPPQLCAAVCVVVAQ
jgi:hypothetical protein